MSFRRRYTTEKKNPLLVLLRRKWLAEISLELSLERGVGSRWVLCSREPSGRPWASVQVQTDMNRNEFSRHTLDYMAENLALAPASY